jgi:hypothetical protein
MDGVAGQHEGARLGQEHEQRLVPGRVAGRGQDHHAAVPEHVVVARELLDLLRRGEGGLDGLGHGPVVLGALDEDGGGRKESDVPDVIAATASGTPVSQRRSPLTCRMR